MVNSGEMLQILKEDNELICRGRERGREVHFLATKKDHKSEGGHQHNVIQTSLSLSSKML